MLSYAEVKALCAGDDRIKEKMDLEVEVAKLRLLKSEYQSTQYQLEDRLLKRYPEQIKKKEAQIAGIEVDQKRQSNIQNQRTTLLESRYWV